MQQRAGNTVLATVQARTLNYVKLKVVFIQTSAHYKLSNGNSSPSHNRAKLVGSQRQFDLSTVNSLSAPSRNSEILVWIPLDTFASTAEIMRAYVIRHHASVPRRSEINMNVVALHHQAFRATVYASYGRRRSFALAQSQGTEDAQAVEVTIDHAVHIISSSLSKTAQSAPAC
eukprot:6019507-Pleurochrysis_carterae.AAC.4